MIGRMCPRSFTGSEAEPDSAEMLDLGRYAQSSHELTRRVGPEGSGLCRTESIHSARQGASMNRLSFPKIELHVHLEATISSEGSFRNGPSQQVRAPLPERS